jgi:hypothetical protein
VNNYSFLCRVYFKDSDHSSIVDDVQPGPSNSTVLYKRNSLILKQDTRVAKFTTKRCIQTTLPLGTKNVITPTPENKTIVRALSRPRIERYFKTLLLSNCQISSLQEM